MTSRRLFLPIAVAVFTLALPTEAAMAKAPTVSQQRQTVSKQKAAAAAKVNGLKASQKELEQALDTLDKDVESKSVRVENARRAYASASANATRVRAAEVATTQRLGHLQDSLKGVAINAYIKGSNGSAAQMNSVNIADLTRSRGLMHAVSGATTDRIDELDALRRELAVQRAEAEAAESTARERQMAVDAQLRAANAAKAAKQRLVDQAETRLEQALAESASLEATDRRLAAQIAANQRSLARRTSSSRSAPSGRGGTTRRPGNVSTTTVRGITVATSIADQLDRMMGAADSDGIHLGGSGYRDSSSQAALRRKNCGSSDYDVYEKPASQCHPPTARPGQSMHEQGLAVDFTSNGSLIRSHSDSGYKWLKAHAGSYGFYNLPSEAWHWSTNGN